jgi:hypothetical protein
MTIIDYILSFIVAIGVCVPVLTVAYLVATSTDPDDFPPKDE